jgi:hypothetical protein
LVVRKEKSMSRLKNYFRNFSPKKILWIFFIGLSLEVITTFYGFLTDANTQIFARTPTWDTALQLNKFNIINVNSNTS